MNARLYIAASAILSAASAVSETQSDDAHVRASQYAAMTNLVERRLSPKSIANPNPPLRRDRPGVWSGPLKDPMTFYAEKAKSESQRFKGVFGSPHIRADRAAIAYLSDYIGTLTVIPTNEMPAEISEARKRDFDSGFEDYSGPRVRESIKKWAEISRYNIFVERYRKELLEAGFADLIRCRCQALPKDERRVFQTNTVSRAKLTERESDLIFHKTNASEASREREIQK